MQEEKLVLMFAGIRRKPLMKIQKSSSVCRYSQKTSDKNKLIETEVFLWMHYDFITVYSTACLNMRNNTTTKVTFHGSLLLSMKIDHKV